MYFIIVISNKPLKMFDKSIVDVCKVLRMVVLQNAMPDFKMLAIQ